MEFNVLRKFLTRGIPLQLVKSLKLKSILKPPLKMPPHQEQSNVPKLNTKLHCVLYIIGFISKILHVCYIFNSRKLCYQNGQVLLLIVVLHLPRNFASPSLLSWFCVVICTIHPAFVNVFHVFLLSLLIFLLLFCCCFVTFNFSCLHSS